MTPKEKAEELYDKMALDWYCDECHNSWVKECAIVAVDEILFLVNDIWMDSFEKGKSDNKFWNYWQEVKEEIEKL